MRGISDNGLRRLAKVVSSYKYPEGKFIENYNGSNIYKFKNKYGDETGLHLYPSLQEARNRIDKSIEEYKEFEKSELQGKIESGQYGLLVKQEDKTYDIYAPGTMPERDDPVESGWSLRKCQDEIFNLEDKYAAGFVWVD